MQTPQQYALFVHGFGRNAAIASSVVRLAAERKAALGSASRLSQIKVYARAKGKPPQEVETLLQRKFSNEGISGVEPHAYCSVKDLAQQFRDHANSAVERGSIPVLVITPRYNLEDIVAGRETIFYESKPTQQIEAELSQLNAVIKCATTANPLQPLEPLIQRDRIAGLKTAYHGITQLGLALAAEFPTSLLEQCYFFFVTNPTDVTTSLFAAASGVSPEHVLSPSDNDRTRYIVELESLLSTTFTQDQREQMRKRLRAYGPHNEWNVVTRESFQSVLEFLQRAGYQNLFTDFDSETLYRECTARANSFGPDVHVIAGVSLDTVLGIIDTLEILFPTDSAALSRAGIHQQTAVKALVYDPQTQLFLGTMIEHDDAQLSDADSVAAALRGVTIPVLHYRSVNLPSEPETTVHLARATDALRRVHERLQNEGLYALTFGESVSSRITQLRERSTQLRVVSNDASLIGSSSLQSGEYVVMGILYQRQKGIGFFRWEGEALKLDRVIPFQETPRSFAYDPETETLLVGTKESIVRVTVGTNNLEILGTIPSLRHERRRTGFNSIALVGEDLAATFPGRGILAITNWRNLSSANRCVLSIVLDKYVGAARTLDAQRVGVIIGEYLVTGTLEEIALYGSQERNGVYTAFNPSPHIPQEVFDRFAFDDWRIAGEHIYALTNDGILYRGNLAEQVLAPVHPSSLKDLSVLLNRRRAVDPRKVLRATVEEQCGKQTTVLYHPNVLYAREDGSVVAFTSSNDVNSVTFLTPKGDVSFTDNASAAYRAILEHNCRLVGVAPQTTQWNRGCLRYIDQPVTSDGTRVAEIAPVGFAVERFKVRS